MDVNCGDCRYFRVTEQREYDRIGQCRLEKVIGIFRDEMKGCSSYTLPGDDRLPKASSSTSRGGSRSRPQSAPMERPEVLSTQLSQVLTALSASSLKGSMKALLSYMTPRPQSELGRVEDGIMRVVPADESLQAKEIPLDQLLHKLVMIRDNLRVLEQKLNSSNHLAASEKVDVHSWLTGAQEAILMLATGWKPGPTVSDEYQSPLRMLEELVREVESNHFVLSVPELGDRWRGGRVEYEGEFGAFNESVSVFYHRILKVREALFGLDAVLESHRNIPTDESEQMLVYLRRCYGTLKTFNYLFKEREDYFNSSGRSG